MFRFLVIFSVTVIPFTSAQFYAQSVPWGNHFFVSRGAYLSTPFVDTVHKYHAQDELGQFAFGHYGDNQAREEMKKLDGTVHGAYSYTDPTGKHIKVRYQADNNGFRILGANNLPVAPETTLEPVKDTPEVVNARAAFTREYEKASKSRTRRNALTLHTSELIPIQDKKTPSSTKLAEIKEKEVVYPFYIVNHHPVWW